MHVKTIYFRIFGAMLLLNNCCMAQANGLPAKDTNQKANQASASHIARPAVTPKLSTCSVFESSASPISRLELVITTTPMSTPITSGQLGGVQLAIIGYSPGGKRFQHTVASSDGAAKMSRALSRVVDDADNWKSRDVGFREEMIRLAEGIAIRFCQDESRKQEIYLQYETQEGPQTFVFSDTAQLKRFQQSIDGGMVKEGIPPT